MAQLDYLKDNRALMSEYHFEKNKDIDIQNITLGSNKRVWWKCKEGHEWQAQINNRYKGTGCPYCSGRRILAGYNDFATWCKSNGRKDLIEEWNIKRNKIEPTEVSPHNQRKVWWICSLGHEWDATIGSRTGNRPSGCPYCSNPPKRILIGFNDFESWCKKNNKEYLLREWDATRNSGITPSDISYGSGSKIWWRCEKGHSWCVSLSNRVQGTGCPVCSRTQTSFPEQAIAYYLSKEFRVLQRHRIGGYEIDIYLEDYRIGIEYDGLFFHSNPNTEKRERRKDAGLKSMGVNVIRIKEDKKKTGMKGNAIYYYPKKSNYLDSDFNFMLLSLFNVIAEKTNHVIGEDVDVVRDELVIREHYASVLKQKSVSEVFPWLVDEWDYEKNNEMKPESFSANAHTKVWWKCEKGHSWKASISSRGRKLGCPYCAGQRSIVGENDFKSWCEIHSPNLLTEWDYDRNTIAPADTSKSSNKKVWWKCEKGHSWEASIANRMHGTRCPICYTGNDGKRKKVSLYEWCVDNSNEELLVEWDYEKNYPLTPESVSKASHAKVWWRCKNNHSWEAQIKSRTYNHGCPYCSKTRKVAIVGDNDLVTWCKENGKEYIIDEWDYAANEGLAPEMFTFGSHKRIQWKCKKGHVWSAVIKERTKHNGNTCPKCKKGRGNKR